MRLVAIVLSLMLPLAAATGWAQTPPAALQAPPIDPSIQGYGDQDKTCLTWTDGCRTCERAADDKITCSNIGIACQPGAIACTSRRPEPAK